MSALAAAKAPDGTLEARNEKIVGDFIDAWGNQDLEAIMSAFASDIVYHNIPFKPLEGLDSCRKFIAPFMTAAKNVEFKTSKLAAVGNTVYTERVDCFEMGGAKLELPVAGIFDIDNDGKISGWRDYFDAKTWADQGGPAVG